MRDMSYFTNIDPINYDYAAQDTMKHLYYRDYKHLINVSFEGETHEPMWLKILAALGFIVCFIVLLFI